MKVEFDVNRKQDLMELCQEYFWAKLYIIEFLPGNWETRAENLIDFFAMLSPLNLTIDKQISECIISMQWGGLQKYRY